MIPSLDCVKIDSSMEINDTILACLKFVTYRLSGNRKKKNDIITVLQASYMYNKS